MLKAIPFANASTTVTAVAYSLCVGFAYVAPDLLYDIFQPWLWATNIQVMRVGKIITYDRALFGLLTISLATWITTYFTIVLYNRWAK